jgi:hypothetical protein
MSSLSRRQSESALSGRNATAGGAVASERSSRIVIIPEPSLGATLWELLSPVLWKLLVFYLKIFLLIASIVMFVVTSVLLYSLVYWLAVPKRLHSYPVFFAYRGEHNNACANVTLANRQWEGLSRPIKEWDRPTGGFDFDVSISLDYPSTDREPVMFETTASLRDHQMIVKTERPFLATRISWLGRLFRDFITMAVTGLNIYRDSQMADVLLIDNLPVLSQENLSYVHICMRSPPLPVYSATLNFVSKLSGFRYMLAHHPVLVGIVVVFSSVAITLFALAVAYVARYFRMKEQEMEEMDSDFREPLSPMSPREDDMTSPATDETSAGLRRRNITS